MLSQSPLLQVQSREFNTLPLVLSLLLVSLRTPAATARLLQGSGCAVASRDIAISAVLEAPSLMDARLNAALKAGSFFFSVCPRFY